MAQARREIQGYQENYPKETGAEEPGVLQKWGGEEEESWGRQENK